MTKIPQGTAIPQGAALDRLAEVQAEIDRV